MNADRRGFLTAGAAALVGSGLQAGDYSDREDTPLGRFRALPRLELATQGTPIEKLDRLREAIPGAPHLYIKRDDCQGYLVGGNKLRKLEYVMADALRKKATTVLTVGGTQSNHARVTAMVARRLGLKCVLVLNGPPVQQPRANFLLDRLMGAEVHLVKTRQERHPTMHRLARELEKKGERVYEVPLGASNEVGSFGFVAAFEEMRKQEAERGGRFDAVVVSSSSGGTQAGLEVGERLFGAGKVQIIGVSPDDSTAEVQAAVRKAANPMLVHLGLPEIRRPEEVMVDDRQVGGGYRISTEQSKEAEALFVRTEGLLLDPVYTSKAAAGLIAACREKKFGRDDHVLFWHTGGLVALFE